MKISKSLTRNMNLSKKDLAATKPNAKDTAMAKCETLGTLLGLEIQSMSAPTRTTSSHLDTGASINQFNPLRVSTIETRIRNDKQNVPLRPCGFALIFREALKQ